MATSLVHRSLAAKPGRFHRASRSGPSEYLANAGADAGIHNCLAVIPINRSPHRDQETNKLSVRPHNYACTLPRPKPLAVDGQIFPSRPPRAEEKISACFAKAFAGGVESGESSASDDTVKLTTPEEAVQRFEHYELVTGEDGKPVELGRGAMVVTYKAFDVDLRCPVALKVISARYLNDESARLRFLRGGRAAAADNSSASFRYDGRECSTGTPSSVCLSEALPENSYR